MNDDLLKALGLTNPTTELADIIRAAPHPDAAAIAVWHWHRARLLDIEHLITGAQDWTDRSAHTDHPDWDALRRILTGDHLEPGS